MEFTQETIDALTVNEVDIMKKIAEELQIRIQQVSAVISLVDEGCKSFSQRRKPLAVIYCLGKSNGKLLLLMESIFIESGRLQILVGFI